MNSPHPSPAPGTPLPWHIGTKLGRFIYDSSEAGGTAVAECDSSIDNGSRHTDEQNAAYIVHAANTLPALVAERDALRAALAEVLKYYPMLWQAEEDVLGVHHNDAQDAESAARAALAQGQGRLGVGLPK